MSSMPPRTYVNRHANLNAVQLGNKKSGFAGGVGMGSTMNRLYRSKAHVSVVDQATIFSMNPNAGGVGRGRSVFGGSGFPRMDGFFRRAPYRYPYRYPIVSTSPAPALLSTLSVEPDYYNGIFSLKLLNKDYDGPVAYVRREIDDVSNDFYSTTSGELTSAEGTTITAFLANTTGRVRSWYDQSGKGNHAYQNAANSQPIIDLANNCLDFGIGLGTNQGYFFFMPSGTVPVGVMDAPYSFVVKHGNSSNSGMGGFISSGARATNQGNSFYVSNNSYQCDWFSNSFGIPYTETTVPAVAAVTYDGSTVSGYRDGIFKNSLTRSGFTNFAETQRIGVANGAIQYALKGQMYSLLIFSTALPQADVTILNVL